MRIKAHPTTNLNVRVFAVVWGPAIGVKLSGFEGADDGLFVYGNASVEKATVRPSGKAVWK